MVIWKYPLDVVGDQEIKTPAVWKPIHIDHQDGVLTLWAEVDPGEELPGGGRLGPEVTRAIVITGTGHPFNAEGLTYIGSSLDPQRPLVWHVYEADQEGKN